MKIGIFTDSHYSSADTTGRLTMRGEKSSIICSRPTRNTSLTLFGSAIRPRLTLRLPYLKAVTPYGLISVGGRRLDRSPYILKHGFHTVNAFERVVEWQKPDEFKNAVGKRISDLPTSLPIFWQGAMLVPSDPTGILR